MLLICAFEAQQNRDHHHRDAQAERTSGHRFATTESVHEDNRKEATYE